MRWWLAGVAVAAFAGGFAAAGPFAGGENAPPTKPAPTRRSPPVVPASPATLGAVEAGPDAHDLDLTQVVPRGGVVTGVWPVPAGRTSPQLVVAWQEGELRGTPSGPHEDGRRWNLTLWDPEPRRDALTRWVPRTLIRASPFPIANRSGRSAVRLADVTGDGRDDVLVGVGNGNHGSEVVAVYAKVRGRVRRIYGDDRILDKTGAVLVGRQIAETWWGADGGLLWFDEPRGGRSVCCPDYRVRYSLRWTGRGWRQVARRRIELPR